MSIFTIASSCLTTFNLPWFMDLTFQIPMQYCSLQHQTLLPSPVTSTIGCCFCFGPVSSFFLELFLHWSSVAYWAPINLWSSSFSVLSFCLFILSWGAQGKYIEVVCHSLLQYSCLEDPVDRGAWQATVHWVAKSWTWLSDFTFTFTLWWSMFCQ